MYHFYDHLTYEQTNTKSNTHAGKLKYRAIYGFQFILYIFPTELNWTIKRIPSPPIVFIAAFIGARVVQYSCKHIRYAVESKCRKNKIKINDPMCNLSKTPEAT